MSYVGGELSALRGEIVKIGRRIAQQDMAGPVVARDPKSWRVRLDLGADPESGEKILSPWLKPKSGSNQTDGFKLSPALPPIGSRMRMMSPSGVVGAASYAAPDCFDDEEKRPDQDADETVLSFGKSRISMKDGAMRIASDAAVLHIQNDGIEISVGGKGYRLSGDQLEMTTRFVAQGGARPAAFKGARDSGGDVLVEGNENFLV